MRKVKDINWFKEVIEPTLSSYDVKYKFFEKGDFGSLSQVEFNSPKMGGEIDFWSSGWLGIHLVDYISENRLLNVFLEPEKELEKEWALEELENLLKGTV